MYQWRNQNMQICHIIRQSTLHMNVSHPPYYFFSQVLVLLSDQGECLQQQIHTHRGTSHFLGVRRKKRVCVRKTWLMFSNQLKYFRTSFHGTIDHLITSSHLLLHKRINHGFFSSMMFHTWNLWWKIPYIRLQWEVIRTKWACVNHRNSTSFNAQ